MESVRRRVSKSETARRFGVNRTTVRRSLKRLDALGGSLPEMRPGSRLKLDERTMLLLGEDLEARPICRAIKITPFSQPKKRSAQASERDEWLGLVWLSVVGRLDARRLVLETRWAPIPR